MRGQKPLSLPVGFELAEDLLSFTGWPVRHFDRIVQALVGAMVSVRRQCFDRRDVAAQFVSDDNPGLAKLGNQSFEKPLCRATSTDRRNTLVELLRWSLILQGLAGPFVQLPCDCAEFCL